MVLTSACGQLPSGHAPAAERSNLVVIVNATHADDVRLVGRVVECAVQRAVIADGADHDQAIASHLQHLH